MRRYFFDLHDIDLIDDEGVEVPDIAAAGGQAARALVETLRTRSRTVCDLLLYGRERVVQNAPMPFA